MEGLHSSKLLMLLARLSANVLDSTPDVVQDFLKSTESKSQQLSFV